MSNNTGWDSLELPGSGARDAQAGSDPVSDFQHSTASAVDAPYVERDEGPELDDEHASSDAALDDGAAAPAPARNGPNKKVLAAMGALSVAMLGGMYVVLAPIFDIVSGGSTSAAAPAAPVRGASLALDAMRSEQPSAQQAQAGSHEGGADAAEASRPGDIAAAPAALAAAAASAAVVAQAAKPADAAPAASAAPAAHASAPGARAHTEQPAATSSEVAAVLSKANQPDRTAPVLAAAPAAPAAVPAAAAPAQPVQTAAAHQQQQAVQTAALTKPAVVIKRAPAGGDQPAAVPARVAPVAATQGAQPQRVARSSTQVARRHAPQKERAAKQKQPEALEQLVDYTLLAINPRSGEFQQAWVRDSKGKLQILSKGDRIGQLRVIRIDGGRGEVVTGAGVIR